MRDGGLGNVSFHSGVHICNHLKKKKKANNNNLGKSNYAVSTATDLYVKKTRWPLCSDKTVLIPIFRPNLKLSEPEEMLSGSIVAF